MNAIKFALAIGWVILMACAIGFALYTAGQSSVRANTVVKVFDGRYGYGPYHGTCAQLPGNKVACAIEENDGNSDHGVEVDSTSEQSFIPEPPCKHGCKNQAFYRGSSHLIPFHAEDTRHAGASLKAAISEAEKEGGIVVLSEPGTYRFEDERLEIRSSLILVDGHDMDISNFFFVGNGRKEPIFVIGK